MSRKANPNRPKVPTSTQRLAARIYCGTNLTALPTSQLEDAAVALCGHPDGYSLGYSRAKTARLAVEAELATRPNRRAVQPAAVGEPQQAPHG